MEPWTLQGHGFRFHLRCRMEVGEVPTTTPPGLYLYFNFGPSRHCFVRNFGRALRDTDGWRREVQMMLFTVLRRRGSGSFDISLLADAFCQYLDAALQRFPAFHGRFMSIHAHIISTMLLQPPTPPLAVHDVMWVADPRAYYGDSRTLRVPIPEFEAEFVDGEMILSLVEDSARGGEGSGDTPASSASAFLERVKIATFGEGEEEKVDADSSCSICLDDYEPAQQLYVMPCRHRFHMGCLERWLARSHVCPMCRFDLSLPVRVRVPVEE